MFSPWRRDEEPCGAQQTVTVTETVLQGAETSTLVDFAYVTTSTEPIATATGRPNIDLDAAYVTSYASEPTTTTVSSSQEATVSVTSTLETTRTLNLVSATSSSSPRPSQCPSKDPSKPSTAPTATIAGSVVGSMAGLALIGLLLSCLLKRKRKLKLTIKRKTETKDNQEVVQQIENIMLQRDQALEDLERTRTIASPKSFDFGFNPSARSPLPKPPIVFAPPPPPPPQWI